MNKNLALFEIFFEDTFDLLRCWFTEKRYITLYGSSNLSDESTHCVDDEEGGPVSKYQNICNLYHFFMRFGKNKSVVNSINLL